MDLLEPSVEETVEILKGLQKHYESFHGVTYTPEAAYTDTAAALLQNTHDVTFRVQVQMKF